MLEVKCLTKVFKTEPVFGGVTALVRAVDDISFSVATGTVTAIVGESGSGKSTVARCICGLEAPDSGQILLADAVPDYKLPGTRRSVQYIFQDTYHSLNPRMRIMDIIAEPIKLHFGLKGAELLEAVKAELVRVGIGGNYLEKFPHELSGGQRQRVVIARALALKPKLLVADEPVSSLDVSIQAQILKLLQDLNKKEGITIIFITHDLRIVKALADNVIVMNEGKIVEQGETETVYSSPKSEYTKQLLSAIPGKN